MKTCIGCKYAEWARTKSGRLSPAGYGECKYKWKMPKLPASMYWIGQREPSPSGGYISRKTGLKEDCVYYTGGNVQVNDTDSTKMRNTFMNKLIPIFLLPILAYAAPPEDCRDRQIIETPELIEQGRALFFNETFNGNGRTCGTCHREERNFVIDAEFIKRLPKSDPLFVFETNPKLKNLEDGKLLRTRGLILENLDGFDKPPVFRAVQTINGLRKTMSIGVIDSVTGTPVHETGWSGDGAPGDGSLRCFAIGAVLQHFPKSLNRTPDVDFRFPTDEELDALLAFQLNTGRQETPPLSRMKFRNADVQAGAFKFSTAVMRTRAGGTDARRCGGCHVDGGAGDQEPLQIDRQRVTNVSGSPKSPVCTGGALTFDGGLGKAQEFEKTIQCNRQTRIVPMFAEIDQAGTKGSFNISSVWESYETRPFFHDHSAPDVEQLLDFYSSDAFNESEGNEGRAFVFTRDDRRQLAALIRVMSTLENIRSALSYIEQNRFDLSGIDMEEARNALAVSGTSREGVKRLEQAQRGLRARFLNKENVVNLLQAARATIVE